VQPELQVSALLGRLTGAGVDFVVIGGVAVIAHGYERNTKDLDICYSPECANLDALAGVLLDIGARLRGIDEEIPFVADARTLLRTQMLTLDTSEGGLGLLVDPSGSPGYRLLKAHAERIDFDDVEILIASIDDLLAMKRAANRPQDEVDVLALTAIRRMREADKRRPTTHQRGVSCDHSS
jgi:hypothetical protein